MHDHWLWLYERMFTENSFRLHHAPLYLLFSLKYWWYIASLSLSLSLSLYIYIYIIVLSNVLLKRQQIISLNMYSLARIKASRQIGSHANLAKTPTKTTPQVEEEIRRKKTYLREKRIGMSGVLEGEVGYTVRTNFIILELAAMLTSFYICQRNVKMSGWQFQHN